jgi:hypothetical protein
MLGYHSRANQLSHPRLNQFSGPKSDARSLEADHEPPQGAWTLSHLTKGLLTFLSSDSSNLKFTPSTALVMLHGYTSKNHPIEQHSHC